MRFAAAERAAAGGTWLQHLGVPGGTGRLWRFPGSGLGRLREEAAALPFPRPMLPLRGLGTPLQPRPRVLRPGRRRAGAGHPGGIRPLLMGAVAVRSGSWVWILFLLLAHRATLGGLFTLFVPQFLCLPTP